ncbi:hypothetical protein [Paenirhodobacter sp.]|uniref:hypothetical protein n=1 Tax=Paenirhodobacter sp. TaxID=1965326 RepID=UPI003B3C861A
MIHIATTNAFIADNLHIIPDVPRFVGNVAYSTYFDLSTQGSSGGPPAPIDPSMYEGQIWMQNNTTLDLRQNVTDSTRAPYLSAGDAAAARGIAVHVADNALFIPNRSPADVGGPYMDDPEVNLAQSALAPQFWGLRQRYSSRSVKDYPEALNDTLVLDPSYATPADAVKIPVPGEGSVLRAGVELTPAEATVADLFGVRKTSPIRGRSRPSLARRFLASRPRSVRGRERNRDYPRRRRSAASTRSPPGSSAMVAGTGTSGTSGITV